MKKIFNFCVMALSFILIVSSCDDGFEEVNTSKTQALLVDPAFILNRAILASSYPSNTVIYEVGVVQQMISPNSGVLTGANYNQDNRNATQTNWQNYYRNVIRNTKDIIAIASEDPTRSNLTQMARILQANAFMILTDTYGSIPYNDAGDGYRSQVLYPAYDGQQEIYTEIIRELTEASAALDPAGKVESAEILYGGDVAKWKKFGYSLLLRAGMRLSAADPTKAATTVNAALAGGIIMENEDNAFVRHDNNYNNPVGFMLNSTEAANFYLTKPFVDILKATDDPRLSAIAIRYKGAKSGPEQIPDIGTTAAEDQIGMPMGHDNNTVVGAAAADGLASFYDYSQVDRRRLTKLGSPNFFVTAAQNHLLLAEARQTGLVTSGPTAAEYFSAGISLHMDQFAQFDEGAAISEGDRDAYVAANPLGAGTELEQINTQYWIASFLNGPEAFANFRRSGFPELEENPYPGKEVPFINRLTYPNSEISVNSENVQAAIAAQGPDDLATKVWWDK